ERALREEVDPADDRRLLLEYADELVADDPPLLLRVLDPGQPAEETLSGVDHQETHPQVFLERLPQELRFLLAHEPVVDVDTRQAIANRAMHECCRDCGIHAA